MLQFETEHRRNRELNAADVPAVNAAWSEIQKFAQTFHGYEYWGSFEHCASIATRREHGDLTKLRTCLFFEQRRWSHAGQEPDADSMTYIRGLVEKIRQKVQKREFD